MDEWKERAKKLYVETQLSIRDIAEAIGVPKSTVHDYYVKNDIKRGQPKVLVFDIETAPGTCYYWRRKTTYINKEMVIEKPGRVLTWAAKWLGEEDVMSDSILAYGDIEDDFKVCESLWHLLDEAGIVIAHNGDRFDIKMINARFLVHGLPPTSPYSSIDTLKIARKYFGFDSNRLDELGQDLGIGRKMQHEGMSLWIRCLNGDREAFDTMLRYNEQDVLLLEELYLKVRSYHKTHPNVSLIVRTSRSNAPSAAATTWSQRASTYTVAPRGISCTNVQTAMALAVAGYRIRPLPRGATSLHQADVHQLTF